jgi:hypothetical protein
MSLTWADIVTDALRELGVLNAVDAASGEDATFGLLRANKILDNWNAESRAVYATVFNPFTLSAAVAPHLIGPTGTTGLIVAQRPVSIESASLTVGDAETTIRIRDAQWWSELGMPDLTGPVTTDLYYEPAWPNGQLNFWPVPSANLAVTLQYRTVLAAVLIGDTFTLPPGYQDAMTLTLAEDLASAYRVQVTRETSLHAMKARDRVFSNNSRIPKLMTQDSGMPGGPRGSFNYLTGV